MLCYHVILLSRDPPQVRSVARLRYAMLVSRSRRLFLCFPTFSFHLCKRGERPYELNKAQDDMRVLPVCVCGCVCTIAGRDNISQ